MRRVRVTRLPLLLALAAVATPLLVPADATAGWPPGPDATPADLAKPDNWPNDARMGSARIATWRDRTATRRPLRTRVAACLGDDAVLATTARPLPLAGAAFATTAGFFLTTRDLDAAAPAASGTETATTSTIRARRRPVTEFGANRNTTTPSRSLRRV